ncbi:hypothetical protein LEP1GSC016_4011 [Leptospira borgpetersenii serovar Hardjo-bovis str. Sponselee]|uniref:Uncharacterized protein n=1 Tax=Leptospira borgpetersenii serovar Hardjo-bovis str. Sponselee TaxID=1303729 RepID=M6BH43_LEPBO|nr:hypothetical protein LEP1GSC016_4011 [Leptospira borgpetersenii serovar Hardjo-bovis str. Sponselee]
MRSSSKKPTILDSVQFCEGVPAISAYKKYLLNVGSLWIFKSLGGRNSTTNYKEKFQRK